ncbi:MAG: carboxypeptidase regulatory-like domain-containing protein [Terriglobales bacterium]
MCVGLAAQNFGALNGAVTDPTGAYVATARVRLANPATGLSRTATTNRLGLYQFAQLPPGSYSLRVEANGFAPFTRAPVQVLVNEPITLNVRLSLAAAATTVTVQGSAAPLLNTTDASLGNALGAQQIAELPIADRNVVELLSLQPGVTYLGENMNQSATDTRSGAVNGLRSDQSNVTLDGTRVNDQNNGYAFFSVLTVPPDSVQEFRVTTANPNANSGYSSGAQVALVTKSGTNLFHGSLYEYNRNTLFSANDTFLKASQLENGQANQAPKLLRNVFGATLGGPISRNRLFFFADYEGRRDAEGESVVRSVPSAGLRDGNISYLVDPAADTSTCPLLSPGPQGAVCTLDAGQIAAMDPLHIGPNAAVLPLLQQYPMPNDPNFGDGLNVEGYRFAPTVHRTFNTYISRLDWHLTRNGSEAMFWRGQLQNDKSPGPPQFPGQQAATTLLDDSKGSILGLTSVITPTMINDFHWGFIRQGGENAGVSLQPAVYLNGLDNLTPFTRSTSYIVPVNEYTDDFTLNSGDHLFQWGGTINAARDRRTSYAQSFSDAQTNVVYLNTAGIANTTSPLDPANNGYPAVAASFAPDYDSPLAVLMGLLPEGDGVYNFNRAGVAIPQGAPILREYAINDYELYGQDSWHLAPSLTLTYGLRWIYEQPPFEVKGLQVSPCVAGAPGCANLGAWYRQRGALALQGEPDSAAGEVSFSLGGPRNQGPGFWNSDHQDVSPRLAVAWAPDFGAGGWGRLLGRKNRVSLRAGYSVMYDHFGMGIVNTFDEHGSFGLSSVIGNPAGSVNVSDVPRFTCLTCLPAACASLNTPGCLFGPAPTGGFPVTPSDSAFAINWGLNSALKTPYAHVFNVAYTRQIGRGSSLELAYVGTIARRLPMQMDLAMPTDLVDPKSKTDYFTAATQLAKLVEANTPTAQVQPIPYWENMFPALAGMDPTAFCGSATPGPATATQMAYAVFACNLHNETFALFLLDTPNFVSQVSPPLPNSALGPYAYYDNQFSSLYSWNNIGTSDYNALQATYNLRLGASLQGQLNYTWSKSLDEASAASREGPYEGTGGTGNDLNGGGIVINSWDPLALRGLSDFNAFDQINSNWVWTLPFGRGQWLGAGASGWLDQLIGGWHFSGLLRWTTGFPISVDNGFQWATNWNIEGLAELQGALPAMKTTDNVVGANGQGQGPNMFPDPAAAITAFRPDWPGESGVRNNIIGAGFFDLDTSLSKTFPLGEAKDLEFSWQSFNATNTVRYDVRSAQPTLDEGPSFGKYNSTISVPRFMQFALRLRF